MLSNPSEFKTTNKVYTLEKSFLKVLLPQAALEERSILKNLPLARLTV